MRRAWLNSATARDALRPRAWGRSRGATGARGDGSERQKVSHGKFQLNYQEIIPGVVKVWAEGGVSVEREGNAFPVPD